jgi:hypothetical protein
VLLSFARFFLEGKRFSFWFFIYISKKGWSELLNLSSFYGGETGLLVARAERTFIKEH